MSVSKTEYDAREPNDPEPPAMARIFRIRAGKKIFEQWQAEFGSETGTSITLGLTSRDKDSSENIFLKFLKKS